tara:strand:+ start:4166 stop:4990 length:825 start_codon:yes stop_codon:yes gene_type:complete
MVNSIGAYLCNTYQNEAWASLANNNIEKYFNFHDIKLSVVNLDNPYVKILSQYPNICPTIRKMLRYYSFLESDNEYGIFIDLDTVIINPLKNVADCIDSGTNLLKTWKFSKEKSANQDYLLRKSVFVNKFFNFEIEFKCSTAFSILNKQFCSDYIKFNEDTLGINITSEQSIKQLSKLVSNKNYVVNDESILEIFLSQPMHFKKHKKPNNYWWFGLWKKYNIIDPMLKNKICYSNFETNLDLLELLNNDYIFWHLSNLNYKKHLLKFTEMFALL